MYVCTYNIIYSLGVSFTFRQMYCIYQRKNMNTRGATLTFHYGCPPAVGKVLQWCERLARTTAFPQHQPTQPTLPRLPPFPLKPLLLGPGWCCWTPSPSAVPFFLLKINASLEDNINNINNTPNPNPTPATRALDRRLLVADTARRQQLPSVAIVGGLEYLKTLSDSSGVYAVTAATAVVCDRMDVPPEGQQQVHRRMMVFRRESR